MTISEAIARAAARLSSQGIQHARLDAEILLRFVLGRDRAWLLTHYPDTLDHAAERSYEAALERRVRREPVQYITGIQEFWGHAFTVTPAVLIPRPETELVVERSLKAAVEIQASCIIDLCTGSGCIAISLAKELPRAHITATDRSSGALAVARENARQHAVADRIRFLEGDLFEPVEAEASGRADIITANPPYVASGELPVLQPEVRDFEPAIALIAGPDGTEIAGRIIREAPGHLQPGGSLIMEMGIGQAAALREIAEKTDAFQEAVILKDLAGIDRVIALTKV